MKHIKMGCIKHNDTFQIIVIQREHINPPNHNWHKDINLEIKIRVLLPSNGVNVSCIPNANSLMTHDPEAMECSDNLIQFSD